jgi:eukaryotic-like serine/threonine-protein kinase
VCYLAKHRSSRTTGPAEDEPGEVSAAGIKYRYRYRSRDAAELNVRRRMRHFVLAISIVLIANAEAAATDVEAATAPPSRFQTLPRRTVELGADLSFSPTSLGPVVILSPDGTVLIFVAHTTDQKRSQLYIRRVNQSHAHPLAGSDGADSPFFSPDGKWVGFFADGELKKISVRGGAAVTLCNAGQAEGNARGGSWAEDGTIFFAASPRAALRRVSSAGGECEPLTNLDATTGEVTHRWPQALLGGKAVMFTANNQTGDFEDANIVVQSLPNGPRKILQRGGYYGRYLRSGHLGYMHGGTLFAVPFDIRRLELTGEPVPTMEGIGGSPAFGGADLSFSAQGALAFVPGQGIGLVVPIQWMDRQGAMQSLRSVPALYNHPQFSPDGRKLAMDIRAGGQYDLWIYEWERDEMSRLTVGAGENRIPVWTPDGGRIAFASTRRDNATRNIYWQRVDGGAEAELLLQSDYEQMPTSWHPTGKFLAYGERNPVSGWDIMILPLDGDELLKRRPGKPTVFLASRFDEENAEFSPDGRWLAYQSNESGRLEVYVRPFPESGEKPPVTIGVGMFPSWSQNSKELYYQNAADWTLMVATYTTVGEAFRSETPEVAGHIPRRGLGMPGFAIHPDGRRFAVLKAAQESTDIRQNHVTLVPDFSGGLRQSARRKR